MEDLLSELKERCQSQPSLSEGETIKQGKSTRFTGRPAHAPDGTIALALSDDAKIIVGESDVRSVQKDGEIYDVEVRSDAHFLLRIDKLFKATVYAREEGKHGTPVAAKHETGSKGPIVDIDIGDIEVCELICGDVYIDGFKFHICVPVNCRTEKK